MSSAPTVVLISPDQRGGAPVLLLHFERWIQQHTNANCVNLLILEKGIYGDDFRRLAPTYSIGQKLGRFYGLLLRLERWRDRMFGRWILGLLERAYEFIVWRRLSAMGVRDGALVVANTVCCAREARILHRHGCRIFTWVMEGVPSIRHLCGGHGTDWIRERSERVVFPSDKMRFEFEASYGLKTGQGVTRYPMIGPEIITDDEAKKLRTQWRERHGVSDSDFLVVGCGNVSFRKSTDLFLQIASQAEIEGVAGMKFAWMGPQSDGCIEMIRRDIKCAHLENRLLLISPEPNSKEFFCASDAFTLLSREEPFGLVVLEASAAGKPVLCFDGAGGAPEFVHDVGFVLPYLDLQGVLRQLLELMKNPSLAQEKGSAGRKKLYEAFSWSARGEQLWNDMIHQ